MESSKPSESLLAFLAGRPGRRPLDGRAPPTRSASLSSAFLARAALAAFSGLSAAAAGFAAFLAAVLVAVFETFTAALAGAFSAAMLTARLAALTGVTAVSSAGEVLPDVLVIVASVVVATRDWGTYAPQGPGARQSAATGPMRVKQASRLKPRAPRWPRRGPMRPNPHSFWPCSPGVRWYREFVAAGFPGVAGAALPATGSASLKGLAPSCLRSTQLRTCNAAGQNPCRTARLAT